jgi:hypothetical protein
MEAATTRENAMNVETRNQETVSGSQAEPGWASRLSLRPSSQFDEGSGALGHLPSGTVARTVALCCALALSAVALRAFSERSESATRIAKASAAPMTAVARPSGD